MYIELHSTLLLLTLTIRPDPVTNDATIESAIFADRGAFNLQKKTGAIAIAVKLADCLVMLAKLGPVHSRKLSTRCWGHYGEAAARNWRLIQGSC